MPVWAIYHLLFEKDGCEPLTYIGAATNRNKGVLHRLHQYGKRTQLPVNVQRAFNDGYTLTNVGLLCWAPIPPVAYRAPVRAIFLFLETAFCLLFWTMRSCTMGYYMPRLCPWVIAELPYGGSCTHFSIDEGIVSIDDHDDEDLTAEQLEDLEKQARARYLERNRIAQSKWLNEGGGKEKVASARAVLRAQNLAAKRYFCEHCETNCGNASELKAHQKTPTCIRKSTGIVKVLKKPRDKALTDRNLAEHRFHCDECNKDYANNSEYLDHRTRPKHLKNVAKLAAQRAGTIPS